MLAEERQQVILQYLRKKHVLKVNDFVRLLGASESTVRRDLQELEEHGLLHRLHGGASLLDHRFQELDMEAKTEKNAVEKRRIARFAAQMIGEKECIFIDAGTTTFAMIPSLRDINVTVVTNSPIHARELSKADVDCYLIGGFLKRTTQALVGSIASYNLLSFRFDRAFIGANGVDIKMGFTTPDPEEATIKRQALEMASQSYVLADNSKFSKVSFCKMFDLCQSAIITDRLPETMRSSYQEGTTIYYAGDRDQ
ncbi:MAG: DeoR/GlpR family DNA-binding transcription regulator [Sporolactobacillus sp.]